MEYDPGRRNRKSIHGNWDTARKQAQNGSKQERLDRYNAMATEDRQKSDDASAVKKRFQNGESLKMSYRSIYGTPLPALARLHPMTDMILFATLQK